MNGSITPLEFHPQADGRIHFLLPTAERGAFRMYLRERKGVRVEMVRAKALPGFDEMMFRPASGGGTSSREACEGIQAAYREWRESH